MSADRPSYRYIKVIVSNYDDAPLKINSAFAEIIPHQIVFAAIGDAAVLYVGSEQASKPRYDLEQTLKEPLKVNATTAQLGSFTENPQFGKQSEKPVPWTEKHKSLLWTAMILIAGVLAGFMFRSLRSIQHQQQQDNLPENKT